MRLERVRYDLFAILMVSMLMPSVGLAYTRPYGPNAAWNIPVAGIPRAADSDTLSSKLWNDAPGARPGNFNIDYDDYTYPVYYVTPSTKLYPVNTTWDTNINGKQIPWDPSWRQNAGTDAQVIILDPATGREWNLWQVSFDGTRVRATNGNLVQAGTQAGNGSNPGDYRTKENGFSSSRGVGIQYFAMLVVPEEIAAGKIEHALSLPVRNTDGCKYVPPATKLEYPDNPCGRIPEGTRFAANLTNAQIDAWIAALPPQLSPGMKSFARTLAVAMRDYGWFITDTSGGAHFQLEALESASSDWAALGLSSVTVNGKVYPQDILDGLLTQQQIYALVPSDLYPASLLSKGTPITPTAATVTTTTATTSPVVTATPTTNGDIASTVFPPRALSATERSRGVSLTWIAPTSGPKPTGYIVYRDGVEILLTSLTSFSEEGLAPETQYTYEIRAYDNLGRRSTPALVRVTTAAERPTPGSSIPIIETQNVAASTGTMVGQSRIVTEPLRVRSLPSIRGTLLGSQLVGARGTVIEGPRVADGYEWWKMDYASGVDGWSAGPYLRRAESSEPLDDIAALYALLAQLVAQLTAIQAVLGR